MENLKEHIIEYFKKQRGLINTAHKEDKLFLVVDNMIEDYFYEVKNEFEKKLKKYFDIFPKLENIVILQDDLIYSQNTQGIEDMQYLINNYYLFRQITRNKNSL